ncbi:MAG: S41 family peptidase [Clostridia bacterium]|nr:S41 family peptidase [Clostridia bacterium]
MEDNNNFNNGFNEYEDKTKMDKTKIMSNAISIAIAIVMSVVVLYALYVVIKPNMSSNVSSDVFTQEQIDRLEEAAKIIEKDYLYDYDKDVMIDGAIEGMVNSLENVYTYYEDEEEYQESMNSGADANYVGIGVHLTFDAETQGIKVLGVMPGSPAESAGMKSGDIILKVDDTYVNIDTYMDSVDAIKGEKDTTVKLSIYRGKEVIEMEIKRAEITENNVSTDIIDDIGYIKVFSFDIGIYDQFRAEYDKLRSQNIKGIIIDLRNNPGGYVYDTLRMLDIFLPKAEVLKLVNKAGEEDVFKTDDREKIDIPMAVLVNQNSASASEIFASAVKDSGKGIVIGTQTFGKGVVQYVRPIKGHGAISIVSSQYFTSSGVVIQDNGIEPNIVVELSDELKNDSYIARDKDLQLQEALKYIKEQL